MTKDELLKTLKAQTHGLLYMSESDYPLRPFYWTSQEFGATDITPQSLLQAAKKPTDRPIAETSFDSFFSPATTPEDWHGPEEKASIAGFQQLVQTLKANLSDLKVFKIGDATKEVYVIGKTASGDFAGVSTKVVET